MEDKTRRLLIQNALKAREQSFSPISRFSVGAALITESGVIYSGCNIECAGLSASNCAERTAFFKAVSEGECSFTAIAVAGGPKDKPIAEYCPPCGICRQVMVQFCRPDTFTIITAIDEETWQEFTLLELLPLPFHR